MAQAALAYCSDPLLERAVPHSTWGAILMQLLASDATL